MDLKQKYDRRNHTIKKITESAMDIRNRRRALPAVDADLVTSLVRNWPAVRVA